MEPTPLSFGDLADLVAVMSDAFHDYPVMRYVLGPAEPYDERLRTLVELFVSNRVYRNDPMIGVRDETGALVDRKSTRLNSSHANISYAVFCLKKKNNNQEAHPDA